MELWMGRGRLHVQLLQLLDTQLAAEDGDEEACMRFGVTGITTTEH
jgi:hypothetical protein